MTLNKQTAAKWLSKVQTTKKARALSAMLYGPPGIGKTSFGANLNKPLFLMTEDGTSSLKQNGLIPEGVPELPVVETWQQVLEILAEVKEASESHKPEVCPDFNTLVIDTVGGLEALCHRFVCDTEYKGDWGPNGFGSYQKGYESSLPHWSAFLNALDRIRDNGVSVWLLGHSTVKTFRNPEGEDYDRFIPDLHSKTFALTHRWCDLILFANYAVQVTDDKKGRGGRDRYLYTEFSAAAEAKNRHGLEPRILMKRTAAETVSELRKAMSK